MIRFTLVALTTVLVIASAMPSYAQLSGADTTLELQPLLDEALFANPEIASAVKAMEMLDAKADQAGILDPPEFTFMSEGMLNFQWDQAMYRRYELMQMIPFPTKLAAQRTLARISSDHAHHAQAEKVFEVLTSVHSTFAELWYLRRSLELTGETSAILRQILDVSSTRYQVGLAGQQEVLRSSVELEKAENSLLALRRRERAMRSMLSSLVGRESGGLTGSPVLPDSVAFTSSIDSLRLLASRRRGMLVHDSSMVVEAEAMKAVAKQEYLPDFKIGIEYMTAPMSPDPMHAWSVKAGITIPFAPWALAKTGAMVEEASLNIEKSKEQLRATRLMVRSAIDDAYERVLSARDRWSRLRSTLVPQSAQAFDATMLSYQTNKADFLSLMDAFRLMVEVRQEEAMMRMEYEQSVAQLERAVGSMNVEHCTH
jgi:outer membrane protein TolC